MRSTSVVTHSCQWCQPTQSVHPLKYPSNDLLQHSSICHFCYWLWKAPPDEAIEDLAESVERWVPEPQSPVLCLPPLQFPLLCPSRRVQVVMYWQFHSLSGHPSYCEMKKALTWPAPAAVLELDVVWDVVRL